jgi:hypothetical protein
VDHLKMMSLALLFSLFLLMSLKFGGAGGTRWHDGRSLRAVLDDRLMVEMSITIAMPAMAPMLL